MKEKKSIVIKVKYAAPGAKAETQSSQPQVITEWNLRRVSAALVGIVVVIVGIFYVFNQEVDPHGQIELSPSNTQSTVTAEQVVQQPLPIEPIVQSALKPETTSVIATPNLGQESKVGKQAVIKIRDIAKSKPINQQQNKSKKINKNVLRALVTNQVVDREPEREINHHLSVNRKSIWIYYFTELNGLNGQKVYHEWFKNNQLISKYELYIAANTWRTSSRKLLSDTAKGQWMVRLLDQSGHLLNEQKFKVD